MIKVAASDGHRLKINADKCDVTIRSSEVKLNINDPFGAFEFDLSKSYERACVLELLDLAAADPSIEIGAFDYSAEGIKGPFQPLKITKFIQKRTSLSVSEQREHATLTAMIRINELSVREIDAAVRAHDKEDQEIVSVDAVRKIMKDLRIHATAEFLAEIKFALDTRDYGECCVVVFRALWFLCLSVSLAFDVIWSESWN